MIKAFLNLPYFAWTAIALVIRWGHALTWLFLAISFFLRGFGPDLNGGSSFFAVAGGFVYLLFIVMIFVMKRKG